MLDELYQEVILDHNKSPRNYGVLDKYTCTSEGNNPLCGDRLTIYVSLNSDNVIENISFKARGCAISIASASIMSEVVKGKTGYTKDHDTQDLIPDTWTRISDGQE